MEEINIPSSWTYGNMLMCCSNIMRNSEFNFIMETEWANGILTMTGDWTNHKKSRRMNQSLWCWEFLPMTSNDNVGAISASTHINTNDSSINNGFNGGPWGQGTALIPAPLSAIAQAEHLTLPCGHVAVTGIPVTWHSKLVDLVAASFWSQKGRHVQIHITTETLLFKLSFYLILPHLDLFSIGPRAWDLGTGPRMSHCPVSDTWLRHLSSVTQMRSSSRSISAALQPAESPVKLVLKQIGISVQLWRLGQPSSSSSQPA